MYVGARSLNEGISKGKKARPRLLKKNCSTGQGEKSDPGSLNPGGS